MSPMCLGHCAELGLVPAGLMTAPVMGADPNFKVRPAALSLTPHLGVCWACGGGKEACKQLLSYIMAIVSACIKLTDSHLS